MLARLADFIEREAGHLVILVFMMGVGVLLVSQGWNRGDVILDGSFGALIYAMKGAIKLPGTSTTVQSSGSSPEARLSTSPRTE